MEKELKEKIINLKAGTAIHFTIHVYGKTDLQKRIIIDLFEKNVNISIIQDIILKKRGRKMSNKKLKKVLTQLDLKGYSEQEIESIIAFEKRSI